MQKVPQIRSSQRLIGARVLVVEDDLLISMDLTAGLTDAGRKLSVPAALQKMPSPLLISGISQSRSSTFVSRRRPLCRSRHNLQAAESHLSSTRVTWTQGKSKKNFRTAKSFTSRLHLKFWSTQLPRY